MKIKDIRVSGKVGVDLRGYAPNTVVDFPQLIGTLVITLEPGKYPYTKTEIEDFLADLTDAYNNRKLVENIVQAALVTVAREQYEAEPELFTAVNEYLKATGQDLDTLIEDLGSEK